jgi:hypothetical protein
MSRVEIAEVVIAPTGAAIPDASVLVLERGTEATATLYSAESGGTILANPLEADAAGRIEAWVDEGSYDLEVSAPGFVTYAARVEAVAGATVVDLVERVTTVEDETATDAELSAAVAALNASLAAHAAGDATDAEVDAAVATLNAAITAKQDAGTAATDAELAAAVSTLTTALAAKQDAATAATDAELSAVASTLTTHAANTANPHAVTKAQVGLGNVDNTSDANKPVSTAQAAAIALKQAPYTVIIEPGKNGVVGDGVADDTAAIVALLDTIPRTPTAYGCDVAWKRGTYKVAPNQIKFEVAGSRIHFEAGCKIECPTATAGSRILHVAQWYVDLTGQPSVSGSGARGNGVGIALGPTTATRYPLDVGSTDSGVHSCTVHQPLISRCEAGIDFAIADAGNGSSGDNTVYDPRITSCKDGIRSRGFVNFVVGGFIQSCDYGCRVTNARSSARVVLSGVTINDSYAAPIKVERGGGSTFNDMWIEQQARTATEACILIADTSSGTHAITSCRFKGVVNGHFYDPHEDYGVVVGGNSHVDIDEVSMSVSDGGVPGVAFVHQLADHSGTLRIAKISYKNGVVPAEWAALPLVVTDPGATGTVAIERVPAAAGAPIGATVPYDEVQGEPLGLDADYYLVTDGATPPTFTAYERDGTVAATATDDASRYPASYVPAVTPTGAGITAGESTSRALLTVLQTLFPTAAAVNGKHLRFGPGTFDLGFNLGWALPANVTDFRISGTGRDRTTILNWITGPADREPLSFTGGDRVHVSDLRLASWGDPYGGGGGMSGDSCDALDGDSLKNSRIENVDVIASRDRAFIFDAQSGATAQAYDCTVSRCRAIGTRSAAPTSGGISAVSGGSLTSREYTYRVTQVDALNRESVSHLLGAITPSGSQKVRVAKPTLAAGAKAWRVYRASSATGGNFYLVATIFDMSLTQWDDDVPDDATGILYDDAGSAVITPELSLLPLGTVRVGMHSFSADRITWRDCEATDTWSSGLMIERKGTTNTLGGTGVRALGCKVRGSKGSGIRVTGGTGWAIRHCQVSNCGTPAAEALEANTGGTAQAAAGVSIARSSATVAVDKGVITDNEIYDDRGSPATSNALSHSASTAAATDITYRRNKTWGLSSAEVSDGAGAASLFKYDTIGVEFVIDGGGSTITTGVKGDVEVPVDGTIVAAALLADQSGAAVVDIWKDTYANFPPVDADSITASAPPTLSSAAKAQDVTLTGWNKIVSKGDVLRFNVDSATTVTRLTVSLTIRRSA